jgi:hypothetical protein
MTSDALITALADAPGFSPSSSTIGDRRGNDLPGRDFEADMRGRRAFLYFDDPPFSLLRALIFMGVSLSVVWWRGRAAAAICPPHPITEVSAA